MSANLSVGTLSHHYIGMHYRAGFFISFDRWGFGFAVHDWGVRFLCLTKQVCVHWSKA